MMLNKCVFAKKEKYEVPQFDICFLFFISYGDTDHFN